VTGRCTECSDLNCASPECRREREEREAQAAAVAYVTALDVPIHPHTAFLQRLAVAPVPPSARGVRKALRSWIELANRELRR
jgi:hypothetical protein